jgi:molybdate transport system ATP-binding protein
MGVEIRVRQRRGDFDLDVAIESDARVLALFGPSGAGKTTILDAVAGLTRPDVARITIDGVVLTDTAKATSLPVHRRRIGYVFQNARLFPHLNVRRNMLYGRWFAGSGPHASSFDDMVGLLGLEHLLERKPATLSGGEAQRVAIARAVLSSPRLLLLDEPLSSLDAARKAETLPYLKRLRDQMKIPMLYVSHDRAEVDRLADGVVELRAGRVLEARA